MEVPGTKARDEGRTEIGLIRHEDALLKLALADERALTDALTAHPPEGAAIAPGVATVCPSGNRACGFLSASVTFFVISSIVVLLVAVGAVPSPTSESSPSSSRAERTLFAHSGVPARTAEGSRRAPQARQAKRAWP